MSEWTFIAVLAVFSLLIPAAPIVLGRLLGPNRPNALKNATYECGVETVGDTWVQFKIQYYIFALVFLVFDIEVVFLFPWAVAFGDIGTFGFWSMIAFLAVLTVGFIYEWKKGALEWD